MDERNSEGSNSALSDQSNKNRLWEHWGVWVGCGVLILGVTVVFALAMWWMIETPQDRGVFGDQFGALNAVFSGFAFCGMLIALYLQRQDLRMQQEEMKAQRKEMELSRDESAKQTLQFKQQCELNQKMLEMQKTQCEEDSFFKSLSTLLSVRNSWKITEIKGTCSDFLASRGRNDKHKVRASHEA